MPWLYELKSVLLRTKNFLSMIGSHMATTSFHLQYSGVDAAAIAAAGLDLFVTEGAPFGVNAAISDVELAQIQATGTLVVGYVNMSVTDDTRSSWQTSWTSNGTDKPCWQELPLGSKHNQPIHLATRQIKQIRRGSRSSSINRSNW
jgi:endo-alpha-1,4-polygalactosaminidase (GH114 family)